MARQLRSKVLEASPDGIEIHVQQLDAMRALRLLHKLTKALGPALAKASKGAGKMALSDMDLGDLSEALELLFEHFSEQDLDDVTRQLLGEGCLLSYQGKKGPSDLFFASAFDGRVDLLLKALVFAIEVNYGPLLSGARGLLGKVNAAPPSISPTTLPTSGQPSA